MSLFIPPGLLGSSHWPLHSHLQQAKRGHGILAPSESFPPVTVETGVKTFKVTLVPSFSYQSKNRPREIKFPQESRHGKGNQRGTAWILKSQGDSWVVVCLPSMPYTLSSILSTSETTTKKENPRENPKDWILALTRGGTCLSEEKQSKTKSNKQRHFPILVICQYTVSRPCITLEIWTKLEWWDNGEMSDTQEY